MTKTTEINRNKEDVETNRKKVNVVFTILKGVIKIDIPHSVYDVSLICIQDPVHDFNLT